MADLNSSRLSLKEAADFLQHSPSWMYANHRSIGLNGYRIGGRWYFDPQDLLNWELSLKGGKGHYRPRNLNSDRGQVKFI